MNAEEELEDVGGEELLVTSNEELLESPDELEFSEELLLIEELLELFNEELLDDVSEATVEELELECPEELLLEL